MGENSWNGQERNQVLLNRGVGTFIEVGTAVGLDSMHDARGMAASDFDRDGDVDFVINNYWAPTTYFVNRVGERRAWLAVRLQGTRSNRDAIGAEVAVLAGGRRFVRIVGAGHGYAAQYSLEQIVGLGDLARADDVEVRWPGGAVEAFGPSYARQRLLLVEGTGRPVAPAPTGAAAAEGKPGRAIPPVLALAIALGAVAALAALSLVRHLRRRALRRSPSGGPR